MEKTSMTDQTRQHYLFIIVGLYMIVPFVREIAESEFMTKYFLVLAFIFTSVMPKNSK